MNQKAPLVHFMGLLLLMLMRCYIIATTPSWHLEFPTCGRNSKPITEFLPYQFSLWDLAPNKGKGVRVIMIDTGIAGYEFENNDCYHKHPDINGRYDPSWGSLSVIKHTHKKCTLSTNVHRCNICPECLPTVTSKDAIKHKILTHGTHTYGLIASSTYGLAPDTEIIVINMFTHEGTCNTAKLIRAVEKAVSLKPDIVLIGANMDEDIPPDSIPARRLVSLFSQIPWVIVPAGNQGCSKPCISQPASLGNVTLCVGAYGITNVNNDSAKKIFIPRFSQRQKGQGPDILAPGYLITSTGVPYDKDQSWSQTLSGTSAAAAITTGFIALLLGEFKDKLPKQVLLEIIHHATWQFDQNAMEHNASLYGILDMRLALFIAHIIMQEKTIQPDKVRRQLIGHKKNEISFLNKLLHIDHHKKTMYKKPIASLQSALQNCIKQIKS